MYLHITCLVFITAPFISWIHFLVDIAKYFSHALHTWIAVLGYHGSLSFRLVPPPLDYNYVYAWKCTYIEYSCMDITIIMYHHLLRGHNSMWPAMKKLTTRELFWKSNRVLDNVQCFCIYLPYYTTRFAHHNDLHLEEKISRETMDSTLVSCHNIIVWFVHLHACILTWCLSLLSFSLSSLPS